MTNFWTPVFTGVTSIIMFYKRPYSSKVKFIFELFANHSFDFLPFGI